MGRALPLIYNIMRDGQIYYTATAGANKIVTAKPAYLHRIIVGKDVASSVIEVSDNASDGDGNVKVYLEGNALGGVHEVGSVFTNGVTMDITNQTNVTIIYSNLGLG